MKPSHCHAFGDQVRILSEWFTQWNECEQTIALYSLLKKITAPQARFLSLVLEHSFRDSSVEVQMLENQANDKDFLCSLCSQTKEVAVRQLLRHLPLLHPGNDEARPEYLNLLHKILSHSMEHGIHEEECRQLLSLALVHPAFPPDERNNLSMWLSHLEDKLHEELQQQQQHQMVSQDSHTVCDNMIRQNYIRSKMNGMSGWRHQQLVHRDSGLGGSFETQSMHPPAKRTDSGLGSSFESTLGPLGCSAYPTLNITVTSAPGPSTSNTHAPLTQTRSNSLTPPPALDMQGAASQSGDGVVVEDFWEEELVSSRPNRSRSFPVDPSRLHYPLSPQSSFDSECGDDYTKIKIYGGNNNEEWKLGMKDVPAWLKSLRLHKYSTLFQQLTYEEMMTLSEDRLEEKGVTKGARNKILLSVHKLAERSETLVSLEKEVLKGGNLKDVLSELKTIVITPIKPHSTTVSVQPSPNQTSTPPDLDDLPAWITRVMGKACTQILVTSKPDEENWQTYMQLLDRVINHDSFTATQKRRFQSWKQQCRRLAPQFPRRPSQDKGRGWATDPLSSIALAGPGVRPRHRTPLRNSKLPNGNQMQNLHPTAGQCRSNNLDTCYISKPRLQRGHAVVSRTKSAPIPPTQQPTILPHQVSADMERINNSLESLCLSMTECALEDSESNDKI